MQHVERGIDNNPACLGIGTYMYNTVNNLEHDIKKKQTSQVDIPFTPFWHDIHYSIE